MTDQDELPGEALPASARAALGRASTWAIPPDGLGERVVADIGAAVAEAPTVRTLRSEAAVGAAHQPARQSWWRSAVAMAAAAIIAFAAGAWFVGTRADDSQSADDAEVATVELRAVGGEASASGIVLDRGAGFAIRLDCDGVPPAPAGHYYQGWLEAVDGARVSVGTFHLRGGDGSVVLWSGVGVDDYPTLVVTDETEAGDGAGAVVLTGAISPA